MALRFLVGLTFLILLTPLAQASNLDNENTPTVKRLRVEQPPHPLDKLSMQEMAKGAYMADVFEQIRLQDRYGERHRYIVQRGSRKRCIDRQGPETPVKNTKGEALDFLSPIPLIIHKEIAYALIMNQPGAFLKLTRTSKKFAVLRTDKNIQNFTLGYLADLTGNPEHFNTVYRSILQNYPCHKLMKILATEQGIKGCFAQNSPYWTMAQLIVAGRLNLYLNPQLYSPHHLYNNPFLPTHLPEFNNLEILIIAAPSLVALSSFKNLTALKTLDLSASYVSEVCLDHSTQLETLALHGQKCTSLPKLTNLVELDLTLEDTADVPGIETLGRSLQSLFLEDPKRTSFPELSALTRLESLRLVGCKIDSPLNFSRNQNLVDLTIDNLGLTSLEGLDCLGNLEYLNAHNNKLRRIHNLDRLTNLRQLRLQNNQLISLAGVEELQFLTDIFVAHNRLRFLPAVWPSSSLRQIQVHGNQIRLIRGLEKLTRLQSLFIAGNKPLVQIRNFDQMTRLDRLYISADQTPTREFLLRNGTRTQENLNSIIRIINPNEGF